jgi:hypothetical protein
MTINEPRGTKMKILVCGSRTISDEKRIFEILDEELFKSIPYIEEIVSGGAIGIDRIAEKWADLHCIKIKQFPADWKKYGRSAGIIRNKEMATYADEVLAIWDGESKGTESTIGFARKQNKLWCVYTLKKDYIEKTN